MFKNLKNDFTFNRRSLSTYYIAILIGYFWLRLLQPYFSQWTLVVAGYFTSWFNSDWQSSGKLWVVFLIISLFLIILIRHFIVEPLGFFVDSEEGKGWESFILSLLLLGFHIYLTNQIFTYAMPIDWWMPIWLIKFLGGYRNTFLPGVDPSIYRETWTWLPWFWYIAPIAVIYIRSKIAMKD